jgi:hypothetical protein
MDALRVNRVVVIGDVGGQGVRRVSHVIESQGLAPRMCSTIYKAVVELGQAQVELIVAAPQVLARENAALISLAEKTGVTCCCLIGSPVSLSDTLIRQIGQGSVALCHAQEFGSWLETYLAQSSPSRSGRCHFHEDVMSEPLVSHAEQAALLGGYVDA